LQIEGPKLKLFKAFCKNFHSIDLMHYLEENDVDGLLLLVDFEKAFDSIEWKFLQKALNSFNFGPSICKWFETFYVDSNSCVISNVQHQ
jgi:hypothetical protein